MNVNANGGTGTVLNLGYITRNAGSTLDVTLPTGTQSATNGVTTTATSGNSNVLTTGNGTAYATVGGTNWAGNTMVATGAIRQITPVTSSGLTFAASENTDMTASAAPTSQVASNTLRFNNGGSTLDLTNAGASAIATGGILVTSAVTAANPAAIASTPTGGTLTAGGPGNELVIINNGALNVSAPIVNGTGGACALTISGFGTTTFTSANRHSGTTTINGGTFTPGQVYTNAAGGTSALPTQTVYVNGGTLGVASGLGNSSLVVNNNGTLAGGGVISNLTTTFNGGSTVSPGAAGAINGIGVLTLASNVTFTGSTGLLSTYSANIAPDGTSDLLRVVGNVDLGSTQDSLVINGATGAASYELLSYTGTLTGAFDNTLLNNATLAASGYVLDYARPGEIDLMAISVPEPGTWALVLLGGAGVVGFSVRRRAQGKAS